MVLVRNAGAPKGADGGGFRRPGARAVDGAGPSLLGALPIGGAAPLCALSVGPRGPARFPPAPAPRTFGSSEGVFKTWARPSCGFARKEWGW